MRTKISNFFLVSIVKLLLRFGIDRANKEVLTIISSDFYRYRSSDNKELLYKEAVSNPGFRFTLFFRLCGAKPESFIRKRIHAFSYFFYKRYFYKYGYQIPVNTNIGLGFQILHFGNIIINPSTRIGNNCTLFPGVTIGQDKTGLSPSIGNKVFIGANSILVGGIKIGNNILIAPGSFVDFDVPDNCLVIGNPGKYYQKSEKIIDGYLNNTI
ncbi:MAG TPA: serine acetyltransferase [Bacteroidales bacterium]|nr:serine acetyltransferase [Bacteroidales bacterium]